MRREVFLWKYVAWVLVAVLLVGCMRKTVSKDELLQSINRTPMLYSIESVAQVSVVERSSRLKEFFGQRTAIIPVEAKLKAGIELSKLTDIKVEGNKVFITLPDPVIEIESTKVLHDRIVTDVAPLRSSFSSDELTQIANKGRMEIEKNLYQYDLVEPAQEQAELIIAGIVREMGLIPVFEKRKVYENEHLLNLVKRP